MFISKGKGQLRYPDTTIYRIISYERIFSTVFYTPLNPTKFHVKHKKRKGNDTKQNRFN